MGTFGGPQGARGQDFVPGEREGEDAGKTHTHTKTPNTSPGHSFACSKSQSSNDIFDL